MTQVKKTRATKSIPSITYFSVNVDLLLKVVRLFEENGYKVTLIPFLFAHGCILAVQNQNEAFLVSPAELGHILRYGLSYLRGFHDIEPLPDKKPDFKRALERYAEQTMARVIFEVENATVGERNQVLFRAAVALGRLLHWEVFDYEEAFYKLLASSTLDENEAQATIRSGLKNGQKRPKDALELDQNLSFKAKQRRRLRKNGK